MKIANVLIISILSIQSVLAQVDTLKVIAQRWVMDNEAYLHQLAISGVLRTTIEEDRSKLASQPQIFIHFKIDGTFETNQSKSNGFEIKTGQWQYLPEEKAIQLKEAKFFIQTLAQNKMTFKSSDKGKVIFTLWVDFPPLLLYKKWLTSIIY